MVKLPIVDQVMSLVRKSGSPGPRRPPGRDERMRMGLEQAPCGVAFVAPDGHWLFTNDRFRRILGYTREELARISLHGITEPDDAKKEAPLIRKLVAGDLDTYRVEKRVMSKNGRYRALDMLVAVARTPEGDVDFFVYLVEEPQAARRHEPARESERAMAALVEQIADVAIIHTDLRGTINGWNRGAERLFGYTRDEMLGRNRRSLYRDADSWAGSSTKQLRNVGESGRLELEDWRVAKDGQHVWVKTVISPVTQDSAVRGYVEVVTVPAAAKQPDMTPVVERLRAEVDKARRTEESLREALEELRVMGEETMNELRIMTVALRKEIDRRKTIELELQRAHEELAAVPLPVAPLPQPEPEPEEEIVPTALPPSRAWKPLDKTTPAELLVAHGSEERSGTLVIASGEQEKEIFFDKGRIFSCASNDPRHFLTQRLLARGVINEDQRRRALEIKQETGLAIGRILLILGAVSEEQIVEAMREKLEDEVAEVFKWKDGRYVFVDGSVPSLQLVPLRIDVARFIVEKLSRDPALVASAKTRKVHRPACISAKRITGQTRVMFNDLRAAEEKGYTRCRTCFR